ncbi:GDP-L-fucose synthase [Desulfovibrio aminophilus]|nr:GDP-L-fucose synthase [Desulfovibrio aminophilus]MCM0753944.1 GDP-L-fucose synthase [Desulfovibrio aminophilus]
MDTGARIFVAGHRGLVGSALARRLRASGHENLLLRTHAELDLTDPAAVAEFFARHKPEYVFLAAAKVGGIHANAAFPADFIRINLLIQTNVLHQAFLHGVRRLLFLGSSCIYPRECPQPMREEHLLSGPLEPTNSAYALAKIAGIEACWAYNRQHGARFLPVMPTNLYGLHDNYDLLNSHVLPALLRKFHLARLARAGDMEAVAADERRFGPIPDDLRASLGLPPHPAREAEAVVWGSGTPVREFLHADDLADACVFLMERYEGDWDRPLVNIGTGRGRTIRELAELVARVTGCDGPVRFDPSRPDGTPVKVLDVSRITALGWSPRIELEQGLRGVYAAYLDGNP